MYYYTGNGFRGSGYDDKFGVGMVNAMKALLIPWSTTVNFVDNKDQLLDADFKILIIIKNQQF